MSPARSAHLLKRFCFRVGDVQKEACTIYIKTPNSTSLGLMVQNQLRKEPVGGTHPTTIGVLTDSCSRSCPWLKGRLPS